LKGVFPVNKKYLVAVGLIVMLLFLTLLTACAPTNDTSEAEESSLQGHYVGYAWQGEVDGVELTEASQYIETILKLDEEGIITDAKMRFFVQKDGFWIARQSGNAFVSVDFSVTPTQATPGENYAPGDSMFTIYTADMMSLYAVAVSPENVTAAALVCPVTRYQYEIRLTPDTDFNMPINEVTIGSGMLVPTIRTSGSGLLRPDDWDLFADRNIFNIDRWSHVVNDKGIFEGIDEGSSLMAFLEAMGVEFADGIPQPLDAKYGYFGLGGWDGNYQAIEEFLIGKNATELTSLIDWSLPYYAGAINDKNQFGVDVTSGATRTVQNSIDGISGATVRMSREGTSYQRALVDAGIITEEDVIIGRF
jgi:hypothetical protein